MSNVNYETLTASQYVRLVSAMQDDKVSAVVLHNNSYVVDNKGVVSVVGQEQMTAQQVAVFKTWLINKYKQVL